MKHFALLLCALFLFVGNIHAQKDTAAFKQFIQEVYTAFELPSLSVAIVHDGKVVIEQQHGYNNAGHTKRADEHTLYAIASLSKAFTATAMAMLVEEGKLDWEDHVKDHLPWFELNDPYVSQHMTVEDLLCHRSGLITFDGDLLWYGTNYSRREVVERIKHRPLTHEFRDEFGYQNIMFVCAGELIAKVSGMSWDEFVAKRILEPIGMTRTTSDFNTFLNDGNIAKPFIKGEEIFMLSYNNSGATAALNSSAYDMSKWMNFWLNDGIVNGDTLLKQSSIQKLWSLHTPLTTGKFDEQNGTNFKGYAQGWFVMDYNGDKIVHHGGGLPGYITKLALNPAQDFGVVALCNDMSSVPSMLMYAAMDWLHGKDYEHWRTDFLKYKKQAAERDQKAYDERMNEQTGTPVYFNEAEYVGTYEDKMYGQAKVFMGEDGLMLSLLPSKELFTGPLGAWSDHAFKFEHNDPFLTFGVVSFEMTDGRPTGFTIDLPNHDFHFHKLNFVRVQ